MEDFLHWSEFVIGFSLVVGLILSDAMRISENRERNNKNSNRRKVRKRSAPKEPKEETAE